MNRPEEHVLNARRFRISRMIRRLVVVCMVATLPSCLPDFLKDDKTEVATILQRRICERSEDSLRTLVEMNDKGIVFHSDRMARLLETEEPRISIDEALDWMILEEYPERVYAVKVRLCIERTTKEFLVDRDDFNRLRVGVITKFVMNKRETAIDSLIAY